MIGYKGIFPSSVQLYIVWNHEVDIVEGRGDLESRPVKSFL
jgi:hypothetical protein